MASVMLMILVTSALGLEELLDALTLVRHPPSYEDKCLNPDDDSGDTNATLDTNSGRNPTSCGTD